MKIRSGFVSNSSSSSFVIYGVWIKDASGVVDFTEDEGDSVIIEKAVKTITDKVFDFEFYNEDELDGYYIGVHPASCPDDMTMGDFKKGIRDRLEKIIPNTSCGWHQEEFYC